MPFSRNISPQITQRSQELFKIYFLGVLPPGRRSPQWLPARRAYSSERPEAANPALNCYVPFSIKLDISAVCG